MVVSLVAMLVLAAPMPGEDESERFKAYFERGEALYQQAEYGMAVHYFRLADQRRVTPEVAYDLAKCHEKLGDQAFTLYYYRLYMKRAPQAPDTLAVAEKVGKQLAKLEGERKGFLELEAPRAQELVVAGRRFPEGPAALFLEPGDFDVQARFPSGVKSMKVSVQAGKATTVTFEPARPPLLAMEMALPADAIARGVESAADVGTPKGRIASYALLGVGAASLIAGALLGFSSSADAAEARSNKKLTVSQARAMADSANQKAIGANVLFGVGGAAAVAGGVLFVFTMPEPGMKSAGTKP